MKRSGSGSLDESFAPVHGHQVHTGAARPRAGSQIHIVAARGDLGSGRSPTFTRQLHSGNGSRLGPTDFTPHPTHGDGTGQRPTPASPECECGALRPKRACHDRSWTDLARAPRSRIGREYIRIYMQRHWRREPLRASERSAKRTSGATISAARRRRPRSADSARRSPSWERHPRSGRQTRSPQQR